MTSREQNETKPQFTKDAIVPSQPNLSWWHCNFCGTDTASEEAPTDHKCANPNGCNAVPTPVPLEAREWLMDIAFVEKGDSDDVMTTISRIVQLLESYSSHVNAALMEKLARYDSQLQASLHAEREDCKKALLALAGVHYCTPAETYGTNSSWAISDLCRAVREFASRISELERERDEARENAASSAIPLSMLYRLATHAKPGFEGQSAVWNWEEAERVTWERIDQAKAVESQLSTTQEALRKCQWKLYECGMELSYVQEAEVLSLCKSAKGEALCNEVMQLLGVDYSIETEEELHRVLSPPTKLP